MNKLIFDRTLQDVTLRTQKGLYNVEDIQRINSYIQYISDELNLNLVVSNVSLGERLTKNKMQSIIDNINKIREVWYVTNDTPSTPLAMSWNYQKANNIEKILQALYDFVESVKIDKIYSGTFRAGKQIKFRGKSV